MKILYEESCNVHLTISKSKVTFDELKSYVKEQISRDTGEVLN